MAILNPDTNYITPPTTEVSTLKLNLYNPTEQYKISIKAPAITSDYVWTMPLSQGGAGTVLTDDGSGNLYWSAGAAVLTTKGDLIYRDAIQPLRLPIGNAGDILTVIGGVPTWTTNAAIAGSSIITQSNGISVGTPNTLNFVGSGFNTTFSGTTTTITSVAYVPPVTTKGDLFIYSSSATRLPIGTDGQKLVADSTNTNGVAWKTDVQTSFPVQNSIISDAHLFSTLAVDPTNPDLLYVLSSTNVSTPNYIVQLQNGSISTTYNFSGPSGFGLHDISVFKVVGNNIYTIAYDGAFGFAPFLNIRNTTTQATILNQFISGNNRTSGGTIINMAVDSSGNTYYSALDNSIIYKVTQSGTVSSFFTTITIGSPLVIDSSNNLYVSGTTSITKITSAGVSSVFATLPTACSTMVIDSLDSIYAFNSGGTELYKVTSAGVVTTVLTGSPAIYYVTTDPSNNVFIYSNSSIRKLTYSSGLISSFGSGISLSSMVAPYSNVVIYNLSGTIKSLARYLVSTL